MVWYIIPAMPQNTKLNNCSPIGLSSDAWLRPHERAYHLAETLGLETAIERADRELTIAINALDIKNASFWQAVLANLNTLPIND